MDLLRQLHREGATICMVTHDPRFAGMRIGRFTCLMGASWMRCGSRLRVRAKVAGDSHSPGLVSLLEVLLIRKTGACVSRRLRLPARGWCRWLALLGVAVGSLFLLIVVLAISFGRHSRCRPFVVGSSARW